jgi:hypothetical protein
VRRPRHPITRALGAALLASALVACDRSASSESHGDASAVGPARTASPTTSPAASPAASLTASVPAAPANDGTDPKSPVLAPEDTGFVDGRKGAGWGDRCFDEIKRGKWGWAHAACDRGLALADVDPKTRPSLLYNEGLIAKQAGDAAAARGYFTQSLALRAATDPGRAAVEKALESVGGKVTALPQAGTYACEHARCRSDQICCPGGAEPASAYCTAYDPNSADFCRLTFRMCDPRTNEPCVAPERCKQGPPGPQQNNLVCGR